MLALKMFDIKQKKIRAADLTGLNVDDRGR